MQTQNAPLKPKTNPPNMNTKLLPALAGLLLSCTTASVAQETLVALGRLNSVAALVNGASPIGGTISTAHPGTGEYEITIDAPGAFAGAGIGDFLVLATIRSLTFTDRGISSRIVSVSPDALVVGINTNDLEDSTAPNSAPAVDVSFQFAVHRIPSGTTMPGNSRFLYAAGSITAGGTLKKAAVADGSDLSVSTPGEGDYLLTFTRPGAFAGFDLEDYLVFVTSGSQSHVQDSIAAASADSKNNDLLNLNVSTADGQDGGDVPVAEDNEFHFVVYRIGDIIPGVPAESSLLVGMASVQGNNGLLRRGTTAYPGGSVTAERSGSGRYRLVFTAPGKFAGRELDDFAFQVHRDSSSSDDNHTSVRPAFIGADSITVDVRTNDLQTNGNTFAEAEDNDFYLTIHDAVATSQPDLRIGKKPSLTRMKGNNLYNSNARGQKILTSPSSSGLARIHLASENDGNVTQDLRTRGKRGVGLSKTRCFRLTGGKKNVTAAFLAAGTTATAVRPGDAVRYEVRTTLPNNSAKSKSVLRFQAGTSPLDRAAAQIVRRP
jgi:hypothetical protein